MNISLNNAFAYPDRTNGYSKNMYSESLQMQGLKSSALEKVDELSEGKVLGIGFIKDSDGNNSYGMAARYAEDSTADNPVVQVSLRKGSEVEYYNVNINEVNPSNATELEMFAYCNYIDEQNMETGNTFGSWQTLKCIDINACANGWTEDTSFTNNFSSAKKNWENICNIMKDEYLGAGIFKQYKDCIKLSDIFHAKNKREV